MVDLANAWARDFITAGIPASGIKKPEKAKIREWGTYIESLTMAANYGSTVWFATKALLTADLAPAAGVPAVVYADTTAANNGIYIKAGASGAGSWGQIITYLPGYQFVTAFDAGAGTANAIVATSSPRVAYTDGVQLIRLNIFETNTSGTVTVAFNGGTALTIQTASGNSPAIGGLAAGMTILGVVDQSASVFRMLSDQTGAAIQAAAEAAQAAAEAAQAAAEAAAAGASGVTPVATRTALKAQDETTKPSAFLYGETGRSGHFVWNGADLSAEIGFMSALSTTVDSGTGEITSVDHGFKDRQAVFVTSTVNGITADTLHYVIEQTTNRLDYDGGTVGFTVGNTLYQSSTGARATIKKVIGTTASGSLWVGPVTTGTFADNGALTELEVGGLATANGLIQVVENTDVVKLASSWANAVADTAITLTGTTNFTLYGHVDPVEAMYVIPTGKAFNGSGGAFVRALPEAGLYQMNWGGASGAADVRPIFDSMKYLARGGELRFGAETYATSGTLSYQGVDNRPLWITGVSETDTVIQNAGTGFTIEYYGLPGGGAENRGGGVSDMKLEKSGGGVCSGVDVANLYRGEIANIDADGCGQTGFRIYGRGAGDTDAAFGMSIRRCRARSGITGCQVRGNTSGSVVGAQLVIEDCNFDSSATAGVHIANADGVKVIRNTLTACGHTDSGAVSGRGGLWVESYGVTCRNILSDSNEYGNGITGCTYDVILESCLGFRSVQDRFIRNSGEIGLGAAIIGYGAIDGTFDSIVFEASQPNVAIAAGYAFLSFAGGTVTYRSPVEIRNFNPITFASTESGVKANYIKIDRGIDARQRAARASVSGSGTIAISSDDTLYHHVTVTAGGGTSINISGVARAGDILTLKITNSSGGATSMTPSSGFSGLAPPTTDAYTHAATFLYNTASGSWQQQNDWGRVA